MATLGSLVLGLRADLARLNSDMNKAVGIVDGAVASMRAAAGVAKSALGGLAAGLVGGLAAGGFASAIKSVVDYGDHLNDLSKATGASVEQLSFLDYAAKQSGSTLDGLVGSISKLQKNLADVAKGDGKEAGKALRDLGLDARQLAQLDLVTQLGTLADALGKVKNPAERAALAQSVFGKSARDLLPLLSAGGNGIKAMADRFVELGGVVTQAQADKFDSLNDSLVDFQTAIGGVGRNIAEAISGPLTSFAQWLVEAPDKVATSLSKITGQFKVWASELKVALAEADAATAEGLSKITGGAFFEKRLQDATAELNQARDGLKQAQEALAYNSGEAPKPTNGAAVLGKANTIAEVSTGLTDAQQKAVEKLNQAQDTYLDGLRKQLILQGNNTELAKVQADIALGAAAKFDAGTQQTALALAEQVDLLNDRKKLQEESAEVEEYMTGVVRERAQLEAKAVTELAAKRAQVLESLATPLEKYTARIKELIDNGIQGEKLAYGIKLARDELDSADQATKDLKNTAQELGLTFSSAFEDAIVAGKSFSDVLQGIAQDIARLFIRKNITEPLVNVLSSALGNAGGIGSFISNIFGGARASGARASGGPVAAGSAYLVGERGPELFVPGMSGGILPNGGGQLPVVVNNYGPRQDVQARNTGREIEITIGSEWAKNVGAGRMAPLGIRPPLATR